MMDARQAGHAWRLAPLALLAGAVPPVAVHLALFVSISDASVESCNPYLHGCTSISAAGRHGLANHLFQAFMLPYATVLACYWLACAAWLKRLGDSGAALRWMPWLGLVSALFLVLYATFLGSEGDFYRLMRRYGVTVYFAFNFLAQLLLAGRLRALSRLGVQPYPAWVGHAKLGLCLAMLALGLANVAGSLAFADNDAFENVIEWNTALLMTAYYFLTWHAWRRGGFSVGVR